MTKMFRTILATLLLLQWAPSAFSAIRGPLTESQFRNMAEYDAGNQRYELKYFIILHDGQTTAAAADLLVFDGKKYKLHQDFIADSQAHAALFQELGWTGKSYEDIALHTEHKVAYSGSVFWMPEFGYYFAINSRSLPKRLLEAEGHHRTLKAAMPFTDQIAYYPSINGEFGIKPGDTDAFTVLPYGSIATKDFETYHAGEAFGILRKYDVGTWATAIAAGVDISNAIVLLDHLPLDLPFSAGIITTIQQPVLSHVSVLSRQRGTVNLYTQRPSNITDITALLDQPVKIVATAKTFTIEASTIAEVDAYIQKLKDQNRIDDFAYPTYTTPTQTLIDLRSEDATTEQIGSKARNYAWLLQNSRTGSNLERRPGFAISAYYYQDFLKQNQLDTVIKALVAAMQAGNLPIKQGSEQIQELIKGANVATELENTLVAALKSAYPDLSPTQRLRLRSSSDAEDLGGFSGAGLYDSAWFCLGDQDNPNEKSVCNGKTTKKRRSLAKTLKRVWMSLFNDRAFRERELYGIDHMRVGMGILIHEAFENEAFNGVLVSANMTDNRALSLAFAFTVNALPGETSVVHADGFNQPELQLINASPYQRVQIKRSPQSPDQDVIPEKFAQRLASSAAKLEGNFLRHLQLDPLKFAIDIEFKGYRDEDGNIKFWIKQIRPFKLPKPVGGFVNTSDFEAFYQNNRGYSVAHELPGLAAEHKILRAIAFNRSSCYNTAPLSAEVYARDLSLTPEQMVDHLTATIGMKRIDDSGWREGYEDGGLGSMHERLADVIDDQGYLTYADIVADPFYGFGSDYRRYDPNSLTETQRADFHARTALLTQLTPYQLTESIRYSDAFDNLRQVRNNDQASAAWLQRSTTIVQELDYINALHDKRDLLEATDSDAFHKFALHHSWSQIVAKIKASYPIDDDTRPIFLDAPWAVEMCLDDHTNIYNVECLIRASQSNLIQYEGVAEKSVVAVVFMAETHIVIIRFQKWYC